MPKILSKEKLDKFADKVSNALSEDYNVQYGKQFDISPLRISRLNRPHWLYQQTITYLLLPDGGIVLRAIIDNGSSRASDATALLAKHEGALQSLVDTHIPQAKFKLSQNGTVVSTGYNASISINYPPTVNQSQLSKDIISVVALIDAVKEYLTGKDYIKAFGEKLVHCMTESHKGTKKKR